MPIASIVVCIRSGPLHYLVMQTITGYAAANIMMWLSLAWSGGDDVGSCLRSVECLVIGATAQAARESTERVNDIRSIAALRGGK